MTFEDKTNAVPDIDLDYKVERIRPSQANQTCLHPYDDLIIMATQSDLTIDITCKRCKDRWYQGIMRVTYHD